VLKSERCFSTKIRLRASLSRLCLKVALRVHGARQSHAEKMPRFKTPFQAILKDLDKDVQIRFS
jgi:hypothetical protein